jgi:hypothetical protein
MTPHWAEDRPLDAAPLAPAEALPGGPAGGGALPSP